MNNKQKQSGFSLMEVMFAVVILALGLVFVATQFPVAISQVRDVVDETNKIIDAHNSQTMLELQLRTISQPNIKTLDYRGDGIDPGRMHLLVKPNVLSDSVPSLGWPVVVLDDPEGLGYFLTHDPPNPPSPLVPDWPFWTYDASFIPLPPDVPPDVAVYISFTYGSNWYYAFAYTVFFIGDIGNVMSPPVDSSDKQVEEQLKSLGLVPGDPTYLEELNKAIFEVSLERNYTWAIFYRENSNEFYIFTMRNPKKTVRYAIQDLASFEFTDITDPLFTGMPASVNPLPADSSLDRKFPVPWRIFLDNIALQDTRYYWKDPPDGSPVPDPDDSTKPIPPPDRFSVNKYVAAILRVGSILIDADPRDRGNPGPHDRVTNGYGAIYEIINIEQISAERYQVTLRTPLSYDDLQSFWVFPPPIVDRSVTPPIYEDTQPVVEVTKKLINY